MEFSFNDKYVIKGGEWLDVAKNLAMTQEIIKQYEAQRNELYLKLQELSGYQSYSYESFIFTKIEVKGSIDYKSIPILKEIDIERYRKPTYSRYTLQYKPSLLGESSSK